MPETKSSTTKPAAKPALKSSAKPAAKSATKAGAGPLSAHPADPKGTKTGVVETDQRSKTRKVVVSYMARHGKYGKYIRQRTVLQVHDEMNESKTGDVVEVSQCRPVSKSKTWRLVRIIEKRSELAAALASAKEIQ